jgi:cation transport ATPase
MAEIHENREECDRLTGMLELQKQHFKQELEYLGGQLREESIRCDRLEEQMNDLTELHQNEMELVKSGVTDMEEKVQYQSEERIRDIQDQLASLQTGISRMEHQQAQHHQLAALEGFENSNARALVVKGINVLLTLLQVVLLLLATSAQILKPFLRTPTRVVTTVFNLPIFGSLPVSKKMKKEEMLSLDTQVLLVTVLVLAIRQWTEIKEFSLQFATKMKNEKKSKVDL